MPAEPTKSGGAPPARLMIKKMVLENFKSYAGIKEIGPFHKCFSSIVGPNGSGKSNVIDSLLFVFGKRASKIRLKKISELIHNSEHHKGLKECSVSVHFHCIVDHEGDDDKYDVVPGSDFVITRVATKKNESRYYLNGKGSSFGEITDLLKTHGVDLDNNRFLILQGEVEQIAMMKPKALNPHQDGLLEYLEDIIGSNKYVEAIEQAYEGVEKLNELRQEKLNRVKIVEKEKDSLEGAKAEAEEWLTREGELNRQRAVLYQLFQHEAESKEAEIAKKQEELQQKLEAERAKLESNAEALKEMEAGYKQKKKEYDTISEAQAKSKSEFTAFERKDVKFREDIKHEKLKQKKLKAKIKKNHANMEKAEAKLEEDAEAVPKLSKRVEELTARKEEEEKVLDSYFEELKGKTQHLRVDMEAKEKELVPLKQVVNEAQQAIDVTEGELKMYSDKVDAAKAAYAEAKATIAGSGEELATKGQQLKAATKELAKTNARLQEAQEELSEAQAQEQALAKQRQALRGKTEEAKASLARDRSRGAVLDQLMAAKRAGKIPGIYGRLGDLGAIDQQYDVAISTACGALNNIVVDNTATGQKCVNFLRAKNLGRATFIIMDKIQYMAKRMNQVKRTPEDVPRLFDLVKPKDDKFLPAFYFALRDTLVADDMDQGLRCANAGKRWRVVSKKGELIDTSGTMSGGGNKVARGGMSSKLSSRDSKADVKEVKSLEKDLAECEKKLKDVHTRRKALEQEIAKLRKQASKLSVEQRKLSMAMEQLQTTADDLQGRLSALKAAQELSKGDSARVKELQSVLGEQQAEMASAKKGTAVLEKEIEALQKKILAAGGARLRTQKAKVESLTTQVDEANTAINKLQVGVKATEKKLNKLKKETKTAEKDLEKLEAHLQQLQDEFKQIEVDAFKVVQAFEAASEELQAKGKELEGIQKEYEGMKKVVDKVRSAEVDINNQMEDLARTLKDNASKAKHWARKLKSVVKKIEENAVLLAKDDDEDEDGEEKKEQEKEKKDEDAMEDDEEQVEEEQSRSTRASRKKKAIPQVGPKAGEAFRMLTAEEVEQVDKEQTQYSITMLEEQLAHMKPNMKAIAEYRRKEKEYGTRVEQLDRTTSERDTARKVYEGLRKKRLDEFMAGFSIITMKLKEMYQMLTLGGDAELELVDSLDPFSEGIVFSVRPPKKSWKNISNLSGGEKTLSSLALVFALHHFKPTPLYVMDEIDAALDFKNVSIVANYIKERTKNAQFVIISLRNNMFELADRLVGIYKTDNATKSITIDPRRFVVPGAVPAATGKENDPKAADAQVTSSGGSVGGSRVPLATR